jgi:HEAT repeat protein
VECLIAVLEDDEWPVREMAAKALGKIGDARAVGPLIKALKRDWPALWVVAEALGQLEDDRAVESLVAALRDSDGDKYTQQAAVEALGRIGEPIQEPLIDVLRDGDEGARHRAIAALGQMRDARDLTPLIEALRSGPSYEVWQGAVEALVQIGEPAVEPLIAVLQGDDWMARRRAAWALGQIGDTRAMKPLIEALQDQTRFVRQEAAEALERIDTPEARSAIRRYRATYPEE